VIVLDSSAAVDYLVALDPGVWVEEQLLAADEVHAPHLIDVEVPNALRRRVHTGVLTALRAEQALADLAELDLTRYPHLPFVGRMWELRDNLSAADAVFAALAEALGATLVTTDRTLARAPGLRAPIAMPPE
jgi:predicted nucleic acid-binding protein